MSNNQWVPFTAVIQCLLIHRSSAGRGIELQLTSQQRVFQGFHVAVYGLCHETNYAELFL